MTDQYIGSAGNLKRLFIPSLGQVQDPDTQRALQAILQWANSLDAVIQLLAGTGITLSPADGEGIVTVNSTGSGGAPVGYAFYGGTDGNPVSDWSQGWGNFAYTAGTDIAFPADTVSIVTVVANVTSNAGPSITELDLLLRDSGNGEIVGSRFSEDGVVEFGTLGQSVTSIADTASGAAPFPWNVAAVVSGASFQAKSWLSIMSFTHP